MAEELDTLFQEDTAPNLTQTTRTQQQHDPATDDPVHANSPLHIPPGTNLHDLNALLNHRARIILQARKQKQQHPPINYNWFARQGPQLPTHGHHSKSSPLSTTDTPSWPWTLNLSWLPLTQQQFPLPSAPTFSAQAWTTWSNPLSWPWKIRLSWLTWLQMQRVSLPWTCETFWSLITNLWLIFLHTTFFPSQPRAQQHTKWTQTPQKRQHQHYPLTQPPGTRSKYRNYFSIWNIIYDPAK
jgi:hypothetical protein